MGNPILPVLYINCWLDYFDSFDSVDVFQSQEILKEKSDYGIDGSVFAGLNSCPINISPQTMVINIQQPANTAVNMAIK